MVFIENGYIIGAIKDGEADAEYLKVVKAVNEKPVPPEGYDYRLREDLTWELCEAHPENEEATEEDYKSALNTLGVNTDEEA